MFELSCTPWYDWWPGILEVGLGTRDARARCPLLHPYVCYPIPLARTSWALAVVSSWEKCKIFYSRVSILITVTLMFCLFSLSIFHDSHEYYKEFFMWFITLLLVQASCIATGFNFLIKIQVAIFIEPEKLLIYSYSCHAFARSYNFEVCISLVSIFVNCLYFLYNLKPSFFGLFPWHYKKIKNPFVQHLYL